MVKRNYTGEGCENFLTVCANRKVEAQERQRVTGERSEVVVIIAQSHVCAVGSREGARAVQTGDSLDTQDKKGRPRQCQSLVMRCPGKCPMSAWPELTRCARERRRLGSRARMHSTEN